MAQQEYILQLQNVVKRFGGITASNDITINVPRGSIYGIIGPNGAGKTTLFNMITGVYDTTEGKVLFEGQQVNGLPTHVIDQLLAEQSTILDAEERSKVMYQIQEELKNDACGAPLYYEQQTYGSGADVNGFIIYPDENASMAYLVRE